MSIIIAIAVLIVLTIAAVAAWILFSRLRKAEERGTLPDQRSDERPEHLAVGTDEQIEEMERARRRETAERQ